VTGDYHKKIKNKNVKCKMTNQKSKIFKIKGLHNNLLYPKERG
jgi:hypothetical protein